MKSDLDKFLDHIDQWKFRVYKKLKGLTPAQRLAHWKRVHEEARARGLPVVDVEEPKKRPAKRVRRTG